MVSLSAQESYGSWGSRYAKNADLQEKAGPPSSPHQRDDAELRPHQSGLFGMSTENMKERVRAAKGPAKAVYDVHNCYHDSGLFQRIARNPYFENTTLGVIVINAIWISIDTDYNKAVTLYDADLTFVIVDSMFFGYFVMEVIIRFMAFKKKCDCMKDPWFVFDSALVTLYAFDPFVLTIVAATNDGVAPDLPTSILRLFRLARLSRLVRMLRSLPELMIMIKGIIQATASVGYTLGLLMLITYVFAIALTQLSRGTEMNEEFFRSVPLAMYGLIIYGTFLDDLAHYCDRIKAESTFCLFLVTLFVILASMTVMNMLVGVLCEVISAVAEEEKESMITDRVHDKFQVICESLDKNKNGLISWTEFHQIIITDGAMEALESVNIDPMGMIDFAEDFFFDDGEWKELTFEQFMDMLLDLRGGQDATRRDIMFLSKKLNRKFYDIKARCQAVDHTLGKAVRKKLNEDDDNDYAEWSSVEMDGQEDGQYEDTLFKT